MNSQERRQARYERRCLLRAQKRNAFKKQYDNFDTVFSYSHLYTSYSKSRKNVGWKASVQKYITQAPLLIEQTWQQLQKGKFKTDGFYEFDINERGKLRHIKSVTIRERIVQKCLCDYALVPVLERSLIYDNGASRKNKGYHFSKRRLKQHLLQYYKKHGNDGYILLFDFSSFFDSISHALCKQIVRRNFTDKRLIKVIDHFIDAFDGDHGLGLGSQISQILALAAVNKLDHFIKEKLQIKYYGRYMDDGYLIHQNKQYLQQCLQKIKTLCDELGVNLNLKKTQICKLSRGFTFIKARCFLTDSGKVIMKIHKGSITRHRRKLKKFAIFVKTGQMDYWDIYTAHQCWRSYAAHFNARKTLYSMDKLYIKLFLPEQIGILF